MQVRVDHASQEYWEGNKERRLMIKRCQECRYWIHFPREMCPRCWSENVKSEQVSGAGRIWSWVTSAGTIRGGRGTTVWVNLDEQEDLRMVADLVDYDASDLTFDAPVRLAWAEHEGLSYPVFTISKAGN